jgi:ketosteroid isomerase-like protein
MNLLRGLIVLSFAALLYADVVPADVAAAAAAAAQPAPATVLAKQADNWDKAIINKDRAAIVANMADDFRQIDWRGRISDKAAFVDGIMSDKLKIDPYGVEDFDVRLYGDVALVSGRTMMTGQYDGKSFTSHYRYTDVYVRKGGQWRVSSVQITPVGE